MSLKVYEVEKDILMSTMVSRTITMINEGSVRIRAFSTLFRIGLLCPKKADKASAPTAITQLSFVMHAATRDSDAIHV